MDERLIFSERTARLIREAVGQFQLDLRGLHVLTEAATGPFAVTASLAAAGGAQVCAAAADSAYGTAAEAAEATRRMGQLCEVDSSIDIQSAAAVTFSDADIVTNLGPLRPINRPQIQRLPPRAVIALMYDTREFRAADVDPEACREFGIPVVGVDEEAPEVDVLKYSGYVAARLLLEIGIEVVSNYIAVAGKSLFTDPICEILQQLGASVLRVEQWSELTNARLEEIDAVIHADYHNTLGPPPAVEMLTAQSGAALIQFVGGCPAEHFRSAGWNVYPKRSLPPQRMWQTFGYVGLRPVIRQHAAALKSASLARSGHTDPGENEFASMCQIMDVSDDLLVK